METVNNGSGRYVLGIDAGGTYTDIVALEGKTGGIAAWAKNLTTYGDLARGISQGMREILETLPREAISSVNLATTLATNAIVEGRSRPSALMLIGYDRSFLEQNGLVGRLGTERVVFIAGGHDLYGNERVPLDEGAVIEGARAMKGSVEAFAVSGFFSVRNPAHELRVQDLIRRETGLPVTCGHDLATELDAVRRATTAVLNAGLIPVLVALLDAVEQEMDAFGLHVPLMVVRGDGSLVSAAWARSHPVETILSGPAASAVGAGFLAAGSGQEESGEDLWVVDMGGTTTDVVRLDPSREPRLSPNGAMVGGFRTLVEAIDIHTLGLGGDSRVAIAPEGEPVIGPRRVIPLCLAADRFPSVLAALETEVLQADPSGYFGMLLPGKPMGSADAEPLELRVRTLLERGPVSLRKVLETERIRSQSMKRLDEMEHRGLFSWCGFTPTDALHVLGKMDVWCGKASKLGASILGGVGLEDVFARQICREVSRSVARELARKSLADEGFTMDECENPMFGLAFREAGAAGPRFLFRLEGAVVGIGAPSRAFLPEVESWVGRNVRVPDGAHVAVALGAAVSSVRYRYGVKLTPMPGGGVRVHSPMGVREFEELEPAVAWAERETFPWVLEQARLAGAKDCRITCRREDMEASISGGNAKVYLGTCLWFQAEEPNAVIEQR